jgi:hypothetical protein
MSAELPTTGFGKVRKIKAGKGKCVEGSGGSGEKHGKDTSGKLTKLE